MTDNEIIKAMECCEKHEDDCTKCPYSDSCFGSMVVPFFLPELLNVFIRQKATIESLESEYDKYPYITVVGNNSEIHSKTAKDYDNLIADIKSEAIKEFADLLVDKIVNTQSVFSVQKATHDFLSGNAHRQQEILDYIYNLVKEMTEVKNECGNKAVHSFERADAGVGVQEAYALPKSRRRYRNGI